MVHRILLVSSALSFSLSARAADPKDLTELFPAGTLAYAEIGQPVGTADSLAEFVKGTLLADSLGHGHDRRDKLMPSMPLHGLKKAGERSLLTSPEMLAEFKKLRGVAAALTGFDAKTGRPSLAIAFVFGESNLAGLLARQYLLTAENIRRVGKVDGIPVYQNRGLTGAITDENGKPEPIDDPAPAQGTAEPTYLYAPGLFVIGSGVEAVRDVYRRFVGTEKSASFAASPHLKSQVEARKKSGLFFCADAAAFELQLIAAKKLTKAEWLRSSIVSYVRFLLAPKQIEAFAGSLQLQPDGWELTANAGIKPGGASPLLALLTGGEASFETARGAPADSPGAFTLAFPARDKRAKAILAAADGIAQALGHAGALPTELAAEAEKNDLNLQTEMLPMIRSATVVLPRPSTDAKAIPASLLAILGFEDEAAARAWLILLPKLSQLLSGAEKIPEPASETIRTIKVYGLVHESVPIHYAVAGTRIIVGRDRDAVAKGATSAANPWPKIEGTHATLGAVEFADVWEKLSPRTPTPPQPDLGQRKTIDDQPVPAAVDSRAAAADEFRKVTAAMPPVVLRANAGGQTLTVRLGQKDLKKPLAKWLEALWNEMELAPADADLRGGLPSIIGGRTAATRDKMIWRAGR